MKDLDRIRERDERDGRSPSIVGVVLLVAFGGVFAGGIWIGQRRAQSHGALSEDPLGPLDGNDGAPRPTEPLVFHEALVLPSPPSKAVNASIAPSRRVPAPSIRVVPPGENVAPDPTEEGDSPALQPPQSAQTEPAPAGEDGIFTLHVASYATDAEAEQFSGQMRRDGHRAFVVSTQVEGRAMYRVRVGPFRTLAEAQRYRLDFEAQMSLPTFIVRRELPETLANPAPPRPSPRRVPAPT